jgi:hypothetical protein
MRNPSLITGIAALLAIAAACQACGPASGPTAPTDTCPAQGHFFAYFPTCGTTPVPASGASKAEDTTPPCRTTGPTATDLGKPTSCGVPGATNCVRVTKAATVAVSPVTSGGCCVITTADGKPTCVSVSAIQHVVLKDGRRAGLVNAIPAPPGKPTVEGSLLRLEALKARKDAIEAEMRKEQEALKGLLNAQQERLNKVGMGPAVPATSTPPSPPPASTPAYPTTGSAPWPAPWHKPGPSPYKTYAPNYTLPSAPGGFSGPAPAAGPASPPQSLSR